MARSSNPLKITATGTGQSDYITLPPGRFAVDIYCGGTCAVTLQRGNGTSFNDLAISSSVMADFSSTGQLNFEIAGSGEYCLQVDTFNTSLVAEFRQVQGV